MIGIGDALSPVAQSAWDRLADGLDWGHGAGATYAPEMLKLVRWIGMCPGLTSRVGGTGASRMARSHDMSQQAVSARLVRLRDMGLIERLVAGGWQLTMAGQEFRELIDTRGVV